MDYGSPLFLAYMEGQEVGNWGLFVIVLIPLTQEICCKWQIHDSHVSKTTCAVRLSKWLWFNK